jgi:hypothetical protein
VTIDAAPASSGKMTVVTLFVTDGDVDLTHESEPSMRFASLELGDGKWAQLVAHFDPEGNIHDLLESARRAARTEMPEGIDVPAGGYFYFWGHRHDGTRFIVGSRLRPAEG